MVFRDMIRITNESSINNKSKSIMIFSAQKSAQKIHNDIYNMYISYINSFMSYMKAELDFLLYLEYQILMRRHGPVF